MHRDTAANLHRAGPSQLSTEDVADLTPLPWDIAANGQEVSHPDSGPDALSTELVVLSCTAFNTGEDWLIWLPSYELV